MHFAFVGLTSTINSGRSAENPHCWAPRGSLGHLIPEGIGATSLVSADILIYLSQTIVCEVIIAQGA